MNGTDIAGKTVTAPAVRKGLGELFAEKKNELDHFQMRMASIVPSFPGQPVGTYFDLAIGVDYHTTITPPSPLMPVPHIGMVYDIMGAIMCAIACVVPPPPPPPVVAAGEIPPPQPAGMAMICAAIVHAMMPTVQANGQWVANAGTGIQHLPGITAHVSFPVVAPMAASEMFMGSSTVLADGGPCSTMSHPALSCNLVGTPPMPRLNKPGTKMALMAPTSALLVNTSCGNPVLVGGPPTIDLFQVGCITGLRGMGKLWRRASVLAAGAVAALFGGALRIRHFRFSRLRIIKKKWHCRLFGEPVDAATGRVYAENTDFTLPGPIPIEWNRTYYSDAEVVGPLGYNWHHNYNMALRDLDDGHAAIRLSDGREAIMQLPALGASFYDRGEQLEISHDEKGYLLTDSAKLRYRFNGPRNRDDYHMLSSIETAEGFSIQFSYNSYGDLKSILDSRGQLIQVQTDEKGRIRKLSTEADGVVINLIQYAYDEQGNLAYTKDSLGALKHFQYKGHLLTQLTGADGQSFYWEYEGSGDDARCVHTWGDNGVLEYWAEYHAGHTKVYNSLGHTTEYFYDEQKLINKIIDANGGVTYQTYNEHQELILTVNPEGLSRKMQYNDRGKLIKLTNENGQVTAYSYDDRDNLTKAVTPAGAAMQWEHDALNRVIKKRLPDGNSLKYEYEGLHLKSITDNRGNSFHLRFDRRHQLMQLFYPNSTYMQWQYDQMGNATSVKDTHGNTTFYTHDSAGNVLTIEEADGNRHSFTYDASTNLIHAKDDLHEVSFSYGSLGVLRSRTQNGRTVRFGYDTELQLKSIRNEVGDVYKFGLDGLGNVVNEWGFDGLHRRYERDGIGRVTRVLRPENRWSSYAYDGVGNMVSERHSDDTGAAYKYNSNGQLIAAMNADITVTLQRDRSGRVIKETQGLHAVNRKFDKYGHASEISSSLGASVKLQHSNLGWLQQMQSGNWQAQWQHNEQGLEIQRQLSGGVSVHTTRDRFGRVSARSIGADNIEQSRTSYRWGKGNRLLHTINELTHARTDFDYDAWDNLVSATYSIGKETETIYRAPDKIGNLFKTPQQKDRKYGKGGQLLQDEKYCYHYDAEGNLVFKEFIKTEQPSAFQSKELEQQYGVKVRGSGAGWLYEWSGNGMLRKVTLPQRSEVTFSYDSLGRRIAKQHKGIVTRWLWDGNVPLHEWRYEGEFPPQSSVDENGQLQMQQEPVENLITWLYEEGSFVPCAKIVGEECFSIVSDYLGTPTHAFSSSGEKIWERELDCYGSLRRGNHEFVPFLYQGQYADRETGLCYNRFRYYDSEAGGYISQDPIGLAGNNPTLYGYVKDTNSWVDLFGLECSFYKGKMNKPASELKPIKRGTKAWDNAVKAQREAVSSGEKFQIRVESSSDAKAFLKESQGNMNRYKVNTQSGRADGLPKYPKGYEQHMGPEGGFNDLQHIKYYNNGTDGHIFYSVPN